jgi:hypothetical protein
MNKIVKFLFLVGISLIFEVLVAVHMKTVVI